jgi:hypothetical protein
MRDFLSRVLAFIRYIFNCQAVINMMSTPTTNHLTKNMNKLSLNRSVVERKEIYNLQQQIHSLVMLAPWLTATTKTLLEE